MEYQLDMLSRQSYLAFSVGSGLSPIVIPSYKSALVPGRPPSLQSWGSSASVFNTQVLFYSLSRQTQVKCNPEVPLETFNKITFMVYYLCTLGYSQAKLEKSHKNIENFVLVLGPSE